ncbi:hypothetical protein ACQ4PT_033315 [Festuca glaucescens]
MERVLQKFDANGDGRITRAELAATFESVGRAATAGEVARIMEEADTDGDGYISFAEFVRANVTANAAMAEEDLRHAFGVFDADDDDLFRVLKGLGEASTVTQCRSMIDVVGCGGHGLVSFGEFKLMMRRGRGLGNART